MDRQANSFVIVNVVNQTAVKNYGFIRSFDTKRGAAIARGAFVRKLEDQSQANHYRVMTRKEFDELFDPMVETKNLMSGKTTMIRKSDKGGCCDVGTERYWSM